MAQGVRRVTDEEMDLRRKLALMCRILGMQGSINLWGHVSIRVPTTDIVLLSPGAGSRRTRIRADQIFALDLDGRVLRNPGGDRPAVVPIEWRIHTQIHRDRPEVMCIAHLHAHASTLMGIVGREIVPVFSQGALAHGGIPTYDDPGLVLTDEAAAELSRTLGHHVACQMRGHGSVVVGDTPELCLQACTFIEENAQYQIEAEALGGVKHFPPEIWPKIAAKHRETGSPEILWRYWQQIIEEQGISL
jgi:ribulose-5-phosphate 4-epimerase/fuculose-1-phosphate aldolase